MTKKITTSNLINIILFLVLIIVVVFGYFYYLKKNPVEMATNAVAPQDVVSYRFLYNLTGKGDYIVSKPEAIAYGSNRIWVADTDKGRVIAYDLNGEPLFDLGNKKEDKIKLRAPIGILVDNNRVFVVDARLRNIVEYSVEGKLVGYFGEKNVPWPSKIRRYNDMYVVLDLAGPGLIYLDSTGKIVHRQLAGGGAKEGQLYFPQDIAVSGNRIYVADSNNDRMQYTDNMKSPLKIIKPAKGQEFSFPYCLAITNNRMFVGSGTSMIVKVYLLGNEPAMKTVINENDGDGTGMGVPKGIAVDDSGKVYVVDPVHSRVMVFTAK